jgi:hypothetical protein
VEGGFSQSHEMIPLMFEEEKFILSLDVGTTTVRSFLYNKQGKHIPFIFFLCGIRTVPTRTFR